MKTLRTIALFIAAAMLVSLAFAQEDQTITREPGLGREVLAVEELQSAMTDPDSFQLISVQLAEEKGIKCSGFGCKHKEHFTFINTCFTYRAHNAMGGYGQPHVTALIGKNEDGVMKRHAGQLIDLGEAYGASVGLGTGFMGTGELNVCQAKKITKDITSEVKAALAPPAAQRTTPADKAKQAQQYADCLKLAVDNPNIACKQ